MTAPTTEKKTNDLHGPNLILDVENFGPIAEAKNIEFKPMTVFVGPSNTGKTYLALLQHSMMKARQRTNAWEPFFDVQESNADMAAVDFRFDILKNDIYPRTEHLINNLEFRSNVESQYGFISYEIPVVELREPSQALLRDVARQYLSRYLDESNKAMLNYFDVRSLRDLANNSNNANQPPMIELQSTSPSFDISVSRSSIDRFEMPRALEITYDLADEARRRRQADPSFEFALDLMFELSSFAASLVRQFPFSHYFRAGRTGLLDAYRELAATLINRSTLRSRLERSTDQLSVGLATSEFLQSLVRLRSIAPPALGGPKMEQVADALERSVLNGRINIAETASITHFEYERSDSGVTVPIDRAASMATELAPIVMFVRQFIEEGDLIIIDEPEAHLHPAAQQQMAAVLAFMVRSGLRVLITTHSHYMVEQLSAFVNASKLDETTRKRALSLGDALGEEDIYLDEDETSVYGFDQSNLDGGTIVYEIPLGEHREYAPRDHSKAVNRQYNRLQRVLEARERLGV